MGWAFVNLSAEYVGGFKNFLPMIINQTTLQP